MNKRLCGRVETSGAQHKLISLFGSLISLTDDNWAIVAAYVMQPIDDVIYNGGLTASECLCEKCGSRISKDMSLFCDSCFVINSKQLKDLPFAFKYGWTIKPAELVPSWLHYSFYSGSSLHSVSSASLLSSSSSPSVSLLSSTSLSASTPASESEFKDDDNFDSKQKPTNKAIGLIRSDSIKFEQIATTTNTEVIATTAIVKNKNMVDKTSKKQKNKQKNTKKKGNTRNKKGDNQKLSKSKSKPTSKPNTEPEMIPMVNVKSDVKTSNCFDLLEDSNDDEEEKEKEKEKENDNINCEPENKDNHENTSIQEIIQVQVTEENEDDNELKNKAEANIRKSVLASGDESTDLNGIALSKALWMSLCNGAYMGPAFVLCDEEIEEEMRKKREEEEIRKEREEDKRRSEDEEERMRRRFEEKERKEAEIKQIKATHSSKLYNVDMCEFILRMLYQYLSKGNFYYSLYYYGVDGFIGSKAEPFYFTLRRHLVLEVLHPLYRQQLLSAKWAPWTCEHLGLNIDHRLIKNLINKYKSYCIPSPTEEGYQQEEQMHILNQIYSAVSIDSSILKVKPVRKPLPALNSAIIKRDTQTGSTVVSATKIASSRLYIFNNYCENKTAAKTMTNTTSITPTKQQQQQATQQATQQQVKSQQTLQQIQKQSLLQSRLTEPLLSRKVQPIRRKHEDYFARAHQRKKDDFRARLPAQNSSST